MQKVLFPFTKWRKNMLFGDPILKNNFIFSIVKGHLDTKKYSFLVNIPSLNGEKHAILMGL